MASCTHIQSTILKLAKTTTQPRQNKTQDQAMTKKLKTKFITDRSLYLRLLTLFKQEATHGMLCNKISNPPCQSKICP